MIPKMQLIRIVRTPQGEIKLDSTGRVNGRGAYLCHNADCLKKAEKSGALARAFEMQIPPEIYECLEGELKKIDG